MCRKPIRIDEFLLQVGEVCFPAVRIYEPSQLTAREKNQIFSIFYPVAMSAFGQAHSEEFARDVYEHLFQCNGLVLVFTAGTKQEDAAKFNGFGAALRTYQTFGDILYLSGAAIHCDYQHRHMYRSLIECVLNGYAFVVTRTQNPAVITTLDHLFGGVMPITKPADEAVLAIGQRVATWLKIEHCYEPASMVCRGVYGHSLYRDKPRSDPDISDRLDQLINSADGDGIIVVCYR